MVCYFNWMVVGLYARSLTGSGWLSVVLGFLWFVEGGCGWLCDFRGFVIRFFWMEVGHCG